MNIKDVLKKNIVSLAVSVSLLGGCAGNISNRPSLRREHFVANYDEVSVTMQAEMFMLDHPNARGFNEEDLVPYKWSSEDLNGNGILDYRRETTVTYNGNNLQEFFETISLDARASPNGYQLYSKTRVVFNSGQPNVVSVETNALNTNRESLLEEINSYRNSPELRSRMAHTAELYRQIQNRNR